MTPCTRMVRDLTQTPTAPRPYVGTGGAFIERNLASDVLCRPSGTPRTGSKTGGSSFRLAASAANRERGYGTLTRRTRTANAAPGEGTTSYDPGRLPSCRVLAISSEPGTHGVFGLKSHVIPAHLFVRRSSAVASATGADSGKTRPNHFRLGQDASDRLLPPVTPPNSPAPALLCSVGLQPSIRSCERGKRPATRGSGGSRRRLALGPSTGRDLRSASARPSGISGALRPRRPNDGTNL